ncbi:MAG TPA: electron transfer flavoprotein subunit beta/FixA family protein [Deltaproteobacteria bacterium]|nr:electron transfer flavoprotein subunit beta/FixA family protein [Deltaproteobacteria bacterium]
MKIGICAKVTADTDARLSPSADGGSFEFSGKSVVGPYDMFAVEEAVQTKEKHGGDTVVFTVGAESDVLSQLRGSVLALGVDKAVIVEDPALANADALGVARALAKAIEAEGVDLVFCGKQAIDDDNVQVPAMIAGLLGWAQVSRVTAFAVDGTSFTATRAMDGGIKQVVSGNLPVLITAERGLNTPRYAKLPAIMKAKKKPTERRDLAALGLSAEAVAPKVSTSAYGSPPERPSGKIIEGDTDTVVAELVRLLREEAKVL